MKKISKKLTLNRETLRHLEDQNLREAAGGFRTEDSCANSCDPGATFICPTSRRICPTNETC